MTTYYKKEGDEFVPVSEYDPDLLDSFSKGASLIVCTPGKRLVRSNIEPNYAALIAASIVAEEEMASSIVEAAKGKPTSTPISPRQRAAWENLKKEFGDDLAGIKYPAAVDIVHKGVEKLIQEAASFLENPAVRSAYDDFVMLVKLTREEK